LSLTGIACAIVGWFVILSTGVLDSGNFEIVQSEAIPPNRVAMLATRWDHQALTGLTYFVVIGDHLYTAKELKYAFHSSRPIFIAERGGLELRRSEPNILRIECKDCGLTKDFIEKQRFSSDDITVQYIGFP
jgi:hypothetical protein